MNRVESGIEGGEQKMVKHWVERGPKGREGNKKKELRDQKVLP